jgi:hypothetical protein
MREKLLITVAALSLAAGSATIAFAQDNSTQQPNATGKERMEKGDKTEGGAQHKMNNTLGQKQGTEPGQKGEMNRGAQNGAASQQGQSAQSEQKKEGEGRTTGQGAQTEKHLGAASQKTQGEATGTQKREGGATQKTQGEATGTQKREGGATQKTQGEATGAEKREGAASEQNQGGTARTEKEKGTSAERNEGEKGAMHNREGSNQNAPTQNQAGTERHEGSTAQGGHEERSRTSARVIGNLHVSQQNATRITETLRSRARSENVHVDVRVGGPLPASVRPMPLPPDVVELVPEYRGYDYVVVDDEIVFVQPSTHVVVGMIDMGPTARADTGMQVAHARPCPTE